MINFGYISNPPAFVDYNSESLENKVSYYQKNPIMLFELDAALFPLDMDFSVESKFSEKIKAFGQFISNSDTRLFLRGNHYKNVESSDEEVWRFTINELNNLERLFSILKLDYNHKIIIQLNEDVVDKLEMENRFLNGWSQLSAELQQRIVLENDEQFFTIVDILEIAEEVKVPVVFNRLNHLLHLPVVTQPESYWISKSMETWEYKDGRPIIRYAQQKVEHNFRAPSKTISVDLFLDFYETIKDQDLDIILESEDGELSALKCAFLISDSKKISFLEQEWSKHKYNILEHSPKSYSQIRSLLKDKKAYPAKEFYLILEKALSESVEMKNAVNTLLHVWGYFKKIALPEEKEHFFEALEEYKNGVIQLADIKKDLYSLAKKYNEKYLLSTYYLNLRYANL